jgi:hypothetical protein
MREFLKAIWVVQEKRGIKGRKLRRVNPWNPFSYLIVGLAIISGLLMFGFLGIKGQIDGTNPFKWQ